MSATTFYADTGAICTSCAIVAVNADTSHLEDRRASEVIGALTQIGMIAVDLGSSAVSCTCDVCGIYGRIDPLYIFEVL